MSDRDIEIVNKEGTKDCPDLFCDVTFKRNKGFSAKSKRTIYSVQMISLSKKEAVQLTTGLNALIFSGHKEAKYNNQGGENDTKTEDKA